MYSGLGYSSYIAEPSLISKLLLYTIDSIYAPTMCI